MKFLVDVFKNSEVFNSLEKAVVHGGSVCATGLSAVHKAHIIYSLCCRKSATAFCVASDEREAQTICNDLASMGMRAYFYPSVILISEIFRAPQESTNTQDLRYCSNSLTANVM